MDKNIYKNYLAILREEMIPAMGCTEPIALAYGAARAREILGKEPERIVAKCSGNIIKNVRCVIIPNSGGLKGIPAGVILGAVAGDASLNMEVLSKVDEKGRARCRELLEADICKVELLDAQIRSNMAIAHEGMTGKYGLGIGRVIRENYSHDMLTRMRSLTAAASEARMGGCDMPVVINSGSGNQGIACSVPLIVYAREMELPDYSLYRALVFSNLLTVYQKQYIGKLSAFCGAVSASCAAGAAITYMVGGDISLIKKTIENTLANIPGIICDGAKISCAAKIAACLDAAFLAHHLAMNGQSYAPYTGILQEETAETISCVGQIGKDGMKETDREILKIMLEH